MRTVAEWFKDTVTYLEGFGNDEEFIKGWLSTSFDIQLSLKDSVGLFIS